MQLLHCSIAVVTKDENKNAKFSALSCGLWSNSSSLSDVPALIVLKTIPTTKSNPKEIKWNLNDDLKNGKPSVVRKQASPNKSKALLLVVPTILPLNLRNFHFFQLQLSLFQTFTSSSLSTCRTFTFRNFNFHFSKLSLLMGEWACHAVTHPWSQLSLSDFLHRHFFYLRQISVKF